MTPHEQAVQNGLRMEWEAARNYCQDWSFYTVVIPYRDKGLSVAIFVSVDQSDKLCLFVQVNNGIDHLYEKLPLMRNPELFDISDGASYDLDELDMLMDSIVLQHKVESCLQ